MSTLATVGDAFKLAFRDAARDVIFADEPEVLVSYGHPGTERPDDIIMFTRVGVGQEPATFSATNRSREETIDLDVLISVARGGGPEVEEVCGARATELLSALEYYVRITDTTLGGVVRHCFLAQYETDGWTVENQQFQGRNISIEATFQAVARITGTK